MTCPKKKSVVCVCVCVRASACVSVCVSVRARVCIYVCVQMCEVSLPHKAWSAPLNKCGNVHTKQSMQLVHVSLSNWHNAVLGTQLAKVCYYSITHSSAPSQGSCVAPAFDRLPALPPQVWLTGLEQDGPPTTSPS